MIIGMMKRIKENKATENELRQLLEQVQMQQEATKEAVVSLRRELDELNTGHRSQEALPDEPAGKWKSAVRRLLSPRSLTLAAIACQTIILYQQTHIIDRQAGTMNEQTTLMDEGLEQQKEQLALYRKQVDEQQKNTLALRREALLRIIYEQKDCRNLFANGPNKAGRAGIYQRMKARRDECPPAHPLRLRQEAVRELADAVTCSPSLYHAK